MPERRIEYLLVRAFLKNEVTVSWRKTATGGLQHSVSGESGVSGGKLHAPRLLPDGQEGWHYVQRLACSLAQGGPRHLH